nr:reverse transcriptase domain-containing protein [Tanacetum cinerariifolium]
RRIQHIVKPGFRAIENIVPMADRTMEELLQAPTEGYGEAIVIPKILAENFEIKTNLLHLVQANKFHGRENDNPHTHISNFKRTTATLKYRDVPNDAIKLMLFPYSLKDRARIWGNNFQNNQGYHAQMNNAPNIQNQGTLLSNTIPNPKGEMKVVKTRSGLAYEGPSIPTEYLLEKVDEQNAEEILDQEHSNSSGSTAQVQPPVVPISIPKPVVPRTQSKPSIPYPSSFADALLIMPKFASTIKSLLANKDKLFELAKVPLNENCSAMLLKKLPEKLGDLGKFLIPCDFPGMEKTFTSRTNPTRMTLELADRSITRPKEVAEDVFVKVGKFHFPTDFVMVDFEADPRVPLILGRSFLRIGRALIDVYGKEITLRVNDESITFNLNQTMRYSSNYDDTLVNRVDVIDVTCKDFVQDVLDFQYNPKSSNPTLVSDDLISKSDSCKVPIVKSSSLTLTPFRESDFSLDEIEEYLNDDSIPTGIKNHVYDSDGDILFLEKLLDEDPCSLLQMDLKLAKESKEKSFVEEPPELELKELPSPLEYAFLEDSNKLPVIIAKNLKVDEREALLNVLKSHKQAIAWKIFDIKGIDQGFCTPKILMEDDYKPAVQSQRRVNPKIHDVIKNEVIKLLDTVSNENNVLIPTRLVTGWRVCIDYRKLNDATRKDHFPLPFMDQMLERKLLRSSKLAMKDLSKAIVVPLSQRRRTVGENRTSWSDKLDDALWAFRTAYKTPIGCTPYKLVYGKSCHLPIDLEHRAYWALKHVNFDLKTAGDHRKLQLNELSELRDQAYENSVIYKERTKKLYDSKIKNRIFNVGDQVLLFNSRLKIFSGKLKTHWSGPFTITYVFPYGTIELSQPNGPNFKVNGHCVKHYFGGDIPSNVTPDLHTLPKDN